MSKEAEIAQILATLHSAQQDLFYVRDLLLQDEDVVRLVARIEPLLAQLFGHVDGTSYWHNDSSKAQATG